jgi:glutamate synthase (NADPH/NADH) large chain
MHISKKDLERMNQQIGLYNPELHKDSCGVGFVADFTGKKSRKIIDYGLEIIKRIEHRGAVGADPETGDGAGIQIQIPDKFFRKVLDPIGIQLPAYGRYAVGFFFTCLEKKHYERKFKILSKK